MSLIQPRATGGRDWVYQKELPEALAQFDKVILKYEGSCKKEGDEVRRTQQKCPTCNKKAVIVSRDENGDWWCWEQFGGCGAKFDKDDWRKRFDEINAFWDKYRKK